MNFDLSQAIAALDRVQVFRLANEARPPARYLFGQFLPEMLKSTFEARGGSMVVYATMAGLVGMDSPYPITGATKVTTFAQDTAKLANTSFLSEQALRELQMMLLRMGNQGASVQVIQQTAVNLLDKVTIQGHLDTMEYLRGQALQTGKIDWVFNGKRLLVDYQIPASNFLTVRTGNDRYGGSSSKFWDDIREQRRLLRKASQIVHVMHADTFDQVRYNAANSVVVTGENGGVYTVRKVNSQGQFTQDTGDTVTIVTYSDEASIPDPVNKGQVINLPFMSTGKMIAVGLRPQNNVFTVGEGSTPDVVYDLGYTHIGPTVEGNLTPGRWGRVYTPENTPWQIATDGVTNGLPVIENPNMVVVAQTAMA